MVLVTGVIIFSGNVKFNGNVSGQINDFFRDYRKVFYDDLSVSRIGEIHVGQHLKHITYFTKVVFY